VIINIAINIIIKNRKEKRPAYTHGDVCDICKKSVVNGHSRCRNHRITSDETRKNMKKELAARLKNGTWRNQYGGYKGGYENKKRLNRSRDKFKSTLSGFHSLYEWDELKKKYGYMCLCCKKIEPQIRLSKDHIIPISKGGSDFIENIQPLCKSCNSRKHNKTINFLASVDEITLITTAS